MHNFVSFILRSAILVSLETGELLGCTACYKKKPNIIISLKSSGLFRDRSRGFIRVKSEL